MSRSVCLDRLTDVAAATTGLVAMPAEGNADRTMVKVPAHGHYHGSLTTISLGACTVLVKGTNNPDPADSSGETLITNTHAAANQQDASFTSKGYKYVFVHVTANAGGVDRIILFLTGFPGAH